MEDAMEDSFFTKESYDSMKKKYEEMLERQQSYEKFVQFMQRVNVWDYSIYDEKPGMIGWHLIERITNKWSLLCRNSIN